jgi:hypothetical protein
VQLKNGAEFFVQPSSLSVDAMLDRAGDPAPLTRMQYCYARGSRGGMAQVLALISTAEQKRWQHKFDLLAVGDLELMAREAYKNLEAVATSKSWKTYAEMYPEYQKEYGGTPTFRTKALMLKVWHQEAAKAAEPPSKWAAAFHAASVRDVQRPDGAYVEVVYDFKTPEQAADFVCSFGKLKVDGGRLIVPEGTGSFAHVRFVAPFVSVATIKVTGKSLHQELRPMGVIFVNAMQALSDPTPMNPVCKLDPEAKSGAETRPSATVENMVDLHPAETAPPTFNWTANDVSFACVNMKGVLLWSVNDKPVGSGKLSDFAAGGWISLFGAQGNQSWSRVEITLRVDPDWRPRK